MSKINKVHARQVFDSRGNPTIEAEVTLENNIKASSIVPSGASTGAFEAHELRDNDNNSFLGKSVYKAVKNVNTIISEKIINLDPNDQKKIDEILLKLDGTENKTKIGANSLLAVSLAVKKASILLNKDFVGFWIDGTILALAARWNIISNLGIWLTVLIDSKESIETLSDKSIS